MKYKVTWEVEVEASSSEKATQEALKTIQDSTSLAKVFIVEENEADLTTQEIPIEFLSF